MSSSDSGTRTSRPWSRSLRRAENGYRASHACFTHRSWVQSCARMLHSLLLGTELHTHASLTALGYRAAHACFTHCSWIQSCTHMLHSLLMDTELHTHASLTAHGYRAAHACFIHRSWVQSCTRVLHRSCVSPFSLHSSFWTVTPHLIAHVSRGCYPMAPPRLEVVLTHRWFSAEKTSAV